MTDSAGEARRVVVIAIDGPSGSGKSTAARGVAIALGLRYLDTGAMYRAVTWWLLEHNVDLAETESVIKHALGLRIDVSTDPEHQQVLVDGVDATAQIRTRLVSNAVSLVAAIPQVRSYLIGRQQEIIRDRAAIGGGIVAEGRDIGTVVAPDAAVKVFLTASEQARAERRTAELVDGAVAASAGTDLTREEHALRDRRDAPQTQVASDAVKIDATKLGLNEVIGLIVDLAGSTRAGA